MCLCVVCASVCLLVEKACGRRRIEPTWVNKEWYPLRKWLQMGRLLPEWDPRCKITIIGMHS